MYGLAWIEQHALGGGLVVPVNVVVAPDEIVILGDDLARGGIGKACVKSHRRAAIGDEPADADQLRATLADAGAESQLVLLTPALWYLSGSGLQSLALQIDEVVSALATQP